MFTSKPIHISKKTFTIALATSLATGSMTIPQIAGVNGVTPFASAESRTTSAQNTIKVQFMPTGRGLIEQSDDHKVRVLSGQPGKKCTHFIPAETLLKAGIDPTKEFTIHLTSHTVVEIVPHGKSATATIKVSKDQKEVHVDPGKAINGISLKTIPDNEQFSGDFADISQGTDPNDANFGYLDIPLFQPTIYFHSLPETKLKPGSQIKLQSPLAYGRTVHYSLETDIDGAKINSTTGEIVYTPPSNFSGGYVEIPVKATMDKNTLGNKYVSGDPYEAQIAYRLYVEPQPQSDIYVTVKDNNDGTYTLSKNDGSQPVTIKTKDGVQSVSQSGNTITFTMADGSKKIVKATQENPVTITDNKDGTATITNGTTTLKVVTDDTHITGVTKTSSGKYEIAQSDGKKWTIDTTSGSVTNLKSDNKGNLIVTIDGKETTVALDKVKVTESNPGKPDNKITLTFPDDNTVTFDATNTYVTDVKKNTNGDYDIYRSDIGDSKTVWKTIVLKDIRDKVAALENKKSPTEAEFNAAKEAIEKAQQSVTDLEQATNTKFDTINDEIATLTTNVERIEGLTIDSIVSDGKGGYTLKRKNGDTVTGKIDTTTGSVTNITSDGKGNLVVTIDGNKTTVALDKMQITESNPGKTDNQITLTFPNGASVTFDAANTFVTDVKKLTNGDYEVTRNDGTKWTVQLSDLRDKITALENTKTVSPQDLQTVQDQLKAAQNAINGLNGNNTKIDTAIKTINDQLTALTPRVDALEKDVAALKNSTIKEVVKNNNGTYTLVRADGTAVPGTINITDGSVTNIAPDGKGNLTVTINGKETTMPLDKVKITESNPGKPDNKITLKFPGGASVTFDVTNTFVTNVKKNAKGDYDIYRSDIGDGTTVWKTIVLKDLRDKVATLENNKSPSETEFNAIKNAINKVQQSVADLERKTNTKFDTINDEITKLTTNVEHIKGLTVNTITSDGKGKYTLTRTNGDTVTGIIDTSGSVTGITPNANGTITVHYNGKPDVTTTPEKVRITESNPDKPDNKITLTFPGGASVTFDAINTYVTDVKKNKDGNYDIYRSDIADGTKVWKTIDLTDLRNKIAALEANQSPTTQDLTAIKDALNKTQASVNNLEQTTNTKFDAVNTELKTLTSNLNRVEGLTIASIVADGKGGYKLKRNNGEMVAGTIDTTTGSITNVASDGKGNITVTIDGEQRTVPLDKVRITETNKGTPQHTVTLTVPGGKSVTFKVFDNYVTDVKKNAQGNYDIYRSDVAGDKTVWKTIDLADLRAQIAALEQKQSPTAQEFNAVREQLREYETLLQSSTTQLRGDVDALRSDLSNITGRVDGIEARLSTVEARQDAWAKCYSGAAMAAIPAVGITLVALISQVHIPGIAQANTNLQKQLGIYRPELTSGTGNAHLHTAAQIAPIIAGVAGLLGAIAYAANACKEYNSTKAVQNTPFGKLNAQLGSSK